MEEIAVDIWNHVKETYGIDIAICAFLFVRLIRVVLRWVFKRPAQEIERKGSQINLENSPDSQVIQISGGAHLFLGKADTPASISAVEKLRMDLADRGLDPRDVVLVLRELKERGTSSGNDNLHADFPREYCRDVERKSEFSRETQKYEITWHLSGLSALGQRVLSILGDDKK